MQRFFTFLAQLSVCLMLVGLTVQADDKKADPTGTWKWTVPGRDGQTREASLKLKLDGEKLTGKMAGRQGNEIDIEEAKIKGDEISFAVVREFNGNKITTKYTGKLAGDTIKGKIQSKNRDGEDRTTDWEAKREK